MAITLSLLLIVLLLVVGVPFWVSLGLGTTVMLATTSALPLTLIGEALFEGVDSFALIAIPLFILTGDIMVRSKLAYDLLGLRGGYVRKSKVRLRDFHRNGLWIICLYLRQ
jgi:C4-dicarboxylate transporter, DctM subunit